MFALTSDGVVFGMGNNEMGQLGIIQNQLPSNQLQGPGSNLLSQNLTAMQTQNSQLSQLMSISSQCNQVAMNSFHSWTPLMYFVDRQIKIQDVKCGEDFSLFLTAEMPQRIFACGQNSSSQLFGISEQFIKEPIELDISSFTQNALFQDQIRQIECGSTFICILMLSGKIFISGQIQDMKLKEPRLVSSPNIDIQRIYCFKNILLVQDQHGQVFYLNSFEVCLQQVKWLKPLQINQIYFQSQSIIFVKDSKNQLYRVDLRNQSYLPVNDKMQLYSSNDNYLVYSYQQIVQEKKPKIAQTQENPNNLSRNQSKLQNQSTMSSNRSGRKYNPNIASQSKFAQVSTIKQSQNAYQTQKPKITKKSAAILANKSSLKFNISMNEDLNYSIVKKSCREEKCQKINNVIIQEQPLDTTIGMFDQLRNASQVQVLQKLLQEAQKEVQNLKLELKCVKDSKDKDQQLIKMLCENLDQYQVGLPCKQCKVYEIEVTTLKQSLDLQQERIEQLQKDQIFVHQQSINSKSSQEFIPGSFIPRSPLSRYNLLNTDPSAMFSDITNFKVNHLQSQHIQQPQQNTNRSNVMNINSSLCIEQKPSARIIEAGIKGINPFDLMRRSECYETKENNFEQQRYFTQSQNSIRYSPNNQRFAKSVIQQDTAVHSVDQNNSQKQNKNVLCQSNGNSRQKCIFTNIRSSVEDDTKSLGESKLRYASIHDSVSDTFDDFLQKSAQKLKKIIKECSTSKKCSANKQRDYSPVKENIYSASPFNLNSFLNNNSKTQLKSQNQSNCSIPRDTKKVQSNSLANSNSKPQNSSSLKRFQEKISKLQESKQRLQDRLQQLNQKTVNFRN
eukprot:403338599